MADMTNRTTERYMAFFVMIMLWAADEECMDLDHLRERIEKSGLLTHEDREQSDSRLAEEKWHQILRNINCNREKGSNFIHAGRLRHLDGGGYCLTENGREFLEQLLQ